MVRHLPNSGGPFPQGSLDRLVRKWQRQRRSSVHQLQSENQLMDGGARLKSLGAASSVRDTNSCSYSGKVMISVEDLAMQDPRTDGVNHPQSFSARPVLRSADEVWVTGSQSREGTR